MMDHNQDYLQGFNNPVNISCRIMVSNLTMEQRASRGQRAQPHKCKAWISSVFIDHMKTDYYHSDVYSNDWELETSCGPVDQCQYSIRSWSTWYMTTQDTSSFITHNVTHKEHFAWWRYQMETFPRYWPFVWGIHRSPVNSPHKCQWREALMFSLICAWTNSWANNRDTGDLRRHRAHYHITVMGGACTLY